MLRRALSFLLSCVMLFTLFIQLPSAAALSVSLTGDQSGAGTSDAESSAEASAFDSAFAADVGESTCFSRDGSLYLGERELFSDNVGQVLYDGDKIIYASRNLLKSYDIETGKRAILETLPRDIISFSLLDGRFYVYDSLSVYAVGGDTLLDMSGEIYARSSGHDWKKVDLSDCLFFSMISEKEMTLCFDNPEFDPEDTYNETKQRTEYRYIVGRDYIVDISSEIANDLTEGMLYDAEYSYKIGKAEFPLDEYPVGSFFTKNGQSCTCHNQGICVASGPKCNCMRYWPTGVAATCEIDLKSSQCWGFAEFCEYRAYGYIDKNSPGLFYNGFGGKLSGGSWTINSVKEKFLAGGAGGHIRVGGHSLFVIAVTSGGMITYECNKSTTGKNCIIYTNSWTWDSFYNRYKTSDLFWYNLPTSGADAPIVSETYEPGNYQVKASSLNLRAAPSTTAEVIDSIPNDTIIQITEFNSAYTWGKTTYNGKTGWVSLDYVFYLTSNVVGIYIDTPANKTAFFVGDSFSSDGLVISARFIDGTTAAISGYTLSGYNMNKAGTYTVKVTYEGLSTSYKITVEEKRIYPKSITLDVDSLSLLEGDTYTLIHTILPTDANMLKLTWKSSDTKVATVDSGYIVTKKQGKVDITVTTENGIVAKCTLYVVKMPEGTSWSTDWQGNPLTALPLGITPLDYSVRYRIKSGSSYGDWIYLNIGDDIPVSSLQGKTVQYQYRAITASFISDGKNAFEPFPVDINTKIDLSKYTLEKDNALFAGWFKTGQAALSLDTSKAYGGSVTVTGDIEFYAGWIELSKLEADPDDPFASGRYIDSFGFAGTALCDAGQNMGIRFISRIGSDLAGALKKLGGRCEYGAVVVMQDYIGDELVINGSSTLLSSRNPVKVAANKIYTTYEGFSPDSSDDYMLYSVLVTGFSDRYIETGFAVRPYIIYRDVNGKTHTFYYTCTGPSTKGGAYYDSLYNVALAAYETSDNKIWIRDNILDKVKH